MSIENLHRQALELRRQILEDMEAEARESEAKLNVAIAKAKKAQKEVNEKAKEAKALAKAAALKLRASRPLKTRKRHPGANYEISGRPEHLAPGAPLRRVEGTKSHSRNLALTRGKRTKAKYQK